MGLKGMWKGRTVFFRCDASPTLGLGHLMRCIALAQGFSRVGAQACFIVRGEGTMASSILRRYGFPCLPLQGEITRRRDFQETLRLVNLGHRLPGPAVIVTDSYRIDLPYQVALRRSGLFVVSIEDRTRRRFAANVMVNPLIGKGQGKNHPPLLCGPPYALLREEFLQRPKPPRAIRRQPRLILVTLGGGATWAQGRRIVRAIARLESPPQTVVVLGGAAHGNGHRGSVEDRVVGGYRCQVQVKVQGMARLVRRADIGISGGGVSCLEMVAMGLPTIAVVMADNQVQAVEVLAGAGVAVSAGPFGQLREKDLADLLAGLMADVARRRAMSTRGQALIDARGADRVVVAVGARLEGGSAP